MLYEYRVDNIVKIVDGDTVDASIDLGFHTFRIMRFRLWGINAPEMHGETKEAGESAKKYVDDWFTKNAHKELRVDTFKDKTDKYGRWIGDFYVCDTTTGGAVSGRQSLSDELVEKGIAVPFMDKGYYIQGKVN